MKDLEPRVGGEHVGDAPVGVLVDDDQPEPAMGLLRERMEERREVVGAVDGRDDEVEAEI